MFDPDDTDQAIACDRQFIAGLQLGWNLGVTESRGYLNRIIETRMAEIAAAKREGVTLSR